MQVSSPSNFLCTFHVLATVNSSCSFVSFFSYLKVVFEHLLPVCAPLVSHILHTIVGCLIPISLGSGVLAKKSLQLLNLLIVTHRAHLGDSISQLPPFPDAPGFEDMRRIHSELKYGANAFTLEDEIKHFLSSTSNISSFANQNSLFDGLHFLQKEVMIANFAEYKSTYNLSTSVKKTMLLLHSSQKRRRS